MQCKGYIRTNLPDSTTLTMLWQTRPVFFFALISNAIFVFNSDCFQVGDLMRVCVTCNRYFWVRSDSESCFLNVQSINKLQGTKIGERHRCCHVCAIFVSFVSWHSASQPSFSEHLLFVLVIEFANWNSTKKNCLLNFITCSFTAFPPLPFQLWSLLRKKISA